MKEIKSYVLDVRVSLTAGRNGFAGSVLQFGSRDEIKIKARVLDKVSLVGPMAWYEYYEYLIIDGKKVETEKIKEPIRLILLN